LNGNREVSQLSQAKNGLGPRQEGEEPKLTTNGCEKSDPFIVARKSSNKAAQAAAEAMEPREGAEGNASQQSMRRAQDRESMSFALERVRQAARHRKKEKFTALAHHLTPDHLREAFYELKRDAAAGVDGVTWHGYEHDLDARIERLHDCLHKGSYRAQPSRQQLIAKADGGQRPLAIPSLEDKIVQRAAARVLEAIYEEDFLGFSYGFRPARRAHDALDALVVGTTKTPVNFILDADIRSFFNEVSQEWLIRFMEYRIGDKRIIRLIRKWLKAGILTDAGVSVSDRGTGQGSVITP
jgi:retron-type reverse transcriptase